MLPDRISRLLSAYVDGELPARQCKAVARLLRRSSEARELLRGLQRDAEQLRGLPRQALRPDFPQQVLQAIASRAEKSAPQTASTRPWRLPALVGLAAAAAVLLVAGLGSYFYLAIVDRHHQNQFAGVTDPEPAEDVLSKPMESTIAPIAKSGARELLTAPSAESDVITSSSPAVASTKNEKVPAEPKPALASQVPRDSVPPLRDPRLRMARFFDLRDFDEQNEKQLQQELQKGTAHLLDLRCPDALKGVERLQTAFKSRGIQFVIDEDAKAALKLGMGKNTTFAVYFDAVTAEEVVATLQRLNSEDRKVQDKRPGAGRLESVTVTTMTQEEQKKLSWQLGIDPGRWEASKAKSEPEDGKTEAATGAARMFRSPKEGVTSQFESTKRAKESFDRQALVVSYTPGRPRPASAQLNQFLDSRNEQRAGTVQILLVLRSTKG